MVTTHNLGYPRMGPRRELKFALESHWNDKKSSAELETVAMELRRAQWQAQTAFDFVPVGDFSFYDHVLDMTVMLGALPSRATASPGDTLAHYFRIARGRGAGDRDGIRPGDMKKWFDTNYHYVVPEIGPDTVFRPDPAALISRFREAREQGVVAKPILLGPLTWLRLGKAKGCDSLALLDKLVPAYSALLGSLASEGADWVQIDEPILVTDLEPEWRRAFETVYREFETLPVRLLLATYFGGPGDNLDTLRALPVAGVHIDAVAGRNELSSVVEALGNEGVLSVGAVDGRNVWKSDLGAILDLLEPLAEKLGERLWLAPSCSLLHVPITLEAETALDPEIRDWLAFADEKIGEVTLLAQALRVGREALKDQLADNARAVAARRDSTRAHDPAVARAVDDIRPEDGCRKSPYSVRAALQRKRLGLPRYPTTTIGSFPQTAAIRKTRMQRRKGEIDEAAYAAGIKQAIAETIAAQEKIGLDVLVHGEAERNDMVEYFGEQLQGFAFTKAGWVQSYGSRCVKPPILYGDASRRKPMTRDWILHAQAQTDKPVKGMLTGPVTILNWSFVRDDQPRADTCRQLALAIREEVLDLESVGVTIVQIDEAALREGLPLRRAAWDAYLDWAVECFRIAANGVRDDTQIHTHMCYSRFNDIIDAIARMDADVITIESARSDMELLEALDSFDYPNEIGPGVYDIHSPNIPPKDEIIARVKRIAERVPPERLWVNPDCGLKTRAWDEIVPALANMVEAARTLRGSTARG